MRKEEEDAAEAPDIPEESDDDSGTEEPKDVQSEENTPVEQ